MLDSAVRSTVGCRHPIGRVGRAWGMLLALPLVLSVVHCGSEIDGAGEDLGPYAEQMPWAEYMATSAMDTVQGAADSTACTTASVRGLSDQIVDEMNCIRPNLMADISGANVSLGSAALPYMQGAAAAALKRATAGRSRLALNSTLRSLAQQWMLYRWYKTGRCGVGLAARHSLQAGADGLGVVGADVEGQRHAGGVQGRVVRHAGDTREA